MHRKNVMYGAIAGVVFMSNMVNAHGTKKTPPAWVWVEVSVVIGGFIILAVAVGIYQSCSKKQRSDAQNQPILNNLPDYSDISSQHLTIAERAECRV